MFKTNSTRIKCSVVTPSQSSQQRNTGLITLKLWREGFTLNDGDIRPYNDPGNREFLAAIKRGEVPAEIRQEVQGAEVRLDMEDHRHEEFVPPKVKVKAFAGKGHMLGRSSSLLFSKTQYQTTLINDLTNCCSCFQPLAGYSWNDCSSRFCRSSSGRGQS